MDRLRLREITAKDLKALLAWINTDSQVPDGTWCKDFGSFKLYSSAKAEDRTPQMRTPIPAYPDSDLHLLHGL